MSRVLTARRKRLFLLLAVGVLLVAAGLFVKQAFRSNLVFYMTPVELSGKRVDPKDVLRVGGFVIPGSIQRTSGDGLEVRFSLGDASAVVPVIFRGVLPDLFSEGKGAIAQGRVDASGTLIATEVLAKHDENYVPPALHGEPKNSGTKQ